MGVRGGQRRPPPGQAGSGDDRERAPAGWLSRNPGSRPDGMGWLRRFRRPAHAALGPRKPARQTGGDSAKGNSPGQANRCRRVPRRSIRSHRNTRLHATQEGRGKAAAAAVGTGCRAACGRHGSLLWFFFAAAGDALSSAPDGCQSASESRCATGDSGYPARSPRLAHKPPSSGSCPRSAGRAETSTSPPSRSRVTPETSSTTRSSDSTRLSSARCANLLERIQLGETLSEASQARFDKECRQ